jgi:hypothetical protein
VGSVLTTLVSSAAAMLGISPQSTALDPQAPAGPFGSLLQFLFVGIRRLGGLVIDQAPTATVGAQDVLATGQITGHVATSDPEGGAVTVSVGQGPAHGKVQVTTDGNYVYTPNADIAATGGTDSFTLVADDGHRALLQTDATGTHLSLFTGTGQTTVPVTVTVAPGTTVTVSRVTFSVVNLSSHPVRYQGLSLNDSADAQDGQPPVGSLLLPGATDNWGVNVGGEAQAEFGEGNNTYSAHFVNPYGQIRSSCKASSGTCDTGGITNTPIVYLKDQPGTVITLDAQQLQEQSWAKNLDSLCSSGRANCHLDLTKEEKTSIPATTGKSPYTNQSNTDETQIFSISKTVSTSTSLSGGVTLSAGIDKLFSEQVSASYGRTVLDSHTFTQSVTADCAPWTVTDMTAAIPVVRDYGNLTVTVGNSTIHADGVHMDSPDPSVQDRYIVTSTDIPHTAASGSVADAATVGDTVTTTNAKAPAAAASAPPPNVEPVLDTIAKVFQWLGGPFVNNAPTATATNVTESRANGLITGTIMTTDANGDPVTLHLSQAPDNGSVTLNADGSFTYTPTAEFAVTGGTDSFNVTADDAHRALLQSSPQGTTLSLFSDTGHTTIPVVVTVTPGLQLTVSTWNFDIVNRSSVPMQFQGYKYNNATVVHEPRIGSVLQPGDVAHFDVETSVGAETAVAKFVTVNAALQAFYGLMSVDVTGRSVGCDKSPNQRCYFTSPSTVSFVDPAGTQITVPDGQGADLIGRICGTGGQGTCNFTWKMNDGGLANPVDIFAPARGLGAAIINRTHKNVSSTITLSDTRSLTTSLNLGGSISATYLQTITGALNFAFGKVTTDSITTTNSLPVTAPPNTMAGLVAADPYTEYTATDVAIHLGNTTYNLKNLKVDVPDPTRNPGVTKTETPLSDDPKAIV